MFGSVLRLDRGGECFWIESPVPPRNRSEINNVADTPVVEGNQVAALDPFDQRALEHEIVVTQRKQVSPVHALRRSRKAKHELWPEVVDHPPITRRGRMMELVNNDVVELLGIKLTKPGGDGLDAAKDNLGVGLLLVSVEEAKVRVGLHAPEHVPALTQDLLSMGHEEHPPILRTRSVESR